VHGWLTGWEDVLPVLAALLSRVDHMEHCLMQGENSGREEAKDMGLGGKVLVLRFIWLVNFRIQSTVLESMVAKR
jgi:hypothetical protein